MTDHKKQGAANREWGEYAEELAVSFLFKEGYAIRERHWKVGNSIEIDIIAEKDFNIVFVEVKARKGDNQDPVDAVDSKKRSKMVRGADIYMSNLNTRYQYRFDIVTITGDKENNRIEHIEDAFMPGLNGRY
jgi:putative endonuclease